MKVYNPILRSNEKMNPKMKKKLLFISVFLIYVNAFASSPLNVELHLYNQSKAIKNGFCNAEVSGGEKPYTYKWSKNSTPLTSNESRGLTEGISYTLTVSDAQGQAITNTFKVPAEHLNEKINFFFSIVVEYFEQFVMFDLFATLNMYDPTIRNSKGEAILYPNGDTQEMSIPFIVVWLVFGAVYFTIKTRFINFRGFKHAIHLIQGKYDNPNDSGEINHFQALTTALSATVGLGNIAGVAIAVSLGGPGAVFWMIIAGFLGMASKFTEATLGVKYRRINSDGSISGGPMYYLRYMFGYHKIGLKFGKFFAVLFSILLIGGSFGRGNMFQANQAFSQFANELEFLKPHGELFGVFLAILVGAVIIGGIKSIARVTSKLVPFMAALYFLASFVIIAMNITNTGEVLSLIYNGAFNAEAAKGGFVGVLIMGFRRAAFSNEAGIGSAAIAHSAVKTKEPISEGIVALLGPFIDTVVICTLTALVLLFTGIYSPETSGGLTGSLLTSAAFSSAIPWFNWVLVVAIFLFAYSTLISWSYYGVKGFDYLFGNLSEKLFGNRKVAEVIYKILFLTFIVVGSASSLGAVIDFSDMMILSMAFPNIIGLIIYTPRVTSELKKYFEKLKSGQIKPYK